MTQPPLSRSRVLVSLLGNLFEHYDTALFAFLSPFLAPLLFPQENPITALVLTYAFFPLGLITRPLGALCFGYIGDRQGRQVALFWSLTGIACTSFCMAWIPFHTGIAWLPPLLFACGRILQNFFAAGEVVGGAIFLLEESPLKQHPFLSGLYSSSTLAGGLLASLAILCLSTNGILEQYWHYLYLLGILPALCGVWILRQPLRPSLLYHERPSLLSLWIHRRAMLRIGLMAGFSYATYSIALVLLNGFIPLVSSCTKEEMMGLNTLLLSFDLIALPVFGWIATRISSTQLMKYAALCITCFAIPCCALLEQGSLVLIATIRFLFVLCGIAFCAPFHSWAQQEVPASSRYITISLGYALGSQLLGTPTAMLSLKLFELTGHSALLALYWSLLAGFAAFVLHRSPQNNYTLRKECL